MLKTKGLLGLYALRRVDDSILNLNKPHGNFIILIILIGIKNYSVVDRELLDVFTTIVEWVKDGPAV